MTFNSVRERRQQRFAVAVRLSGIDELIGWRETDAVGELRVGRDANLVAGPPALPEEPPELVPAEPEEPPELAPAPPSCAAV